MMLLLDYSLITLSLVMQFDSNPTDLIKTQILSLMEFSKN
jgi:hypothetical protein